MPVETIVIEGGTVVSNVRLGQKRHFDRAPATFRHPFNGHYQTDPIGPLGADTVEKVENRKTPKISQMLIFGQVRRWDAA